MSSINGPMKIEHDGFLFQEETSISKEWPEAIIIREVFFPGTSLPLTSGLTTEIPICINTSNTRDTISTTAARTLTGIPKRDLDAWADSPNPPTVSVSWAFPGQETPVFTFRLCLVRDNSPTTQSTGSIVFAHSLKSEWELADSVQRTTAIGASFDTYSIYAAPQQQIPQRRPNASRLAYCATCGKRESRSRRRRISNHRCGAMASTESDW